MDIIQRFIPIIRRIGIWLSDQFPMTKGSFDRTLATVRVATVYPPKRDTEHKITQGIYAWSNARREFWDQTRWQCKRCDKISLQSELLIAMNPFDPMDMILGCPFCKQCSEGFTGICDEPNCTFEASSGWPTDDGGYRRTCHEHTRG